MAAASPSALHAGLAFALRHARLLTLAAVTVVVAFVTLPIFTLPQLDADDYRYLDLVRQLRAGRVGWVMASIIENRWDHLWWIDCEQAVRFFRPTLMLSYLADDLLHGGSARGLLLTNALLYLATCLLAALLLLRVVRHALGAALASVLFAGFAAHAETIWYVAGRNETLAAVGFFAALLCHGLAGRRRWLALPCYLFALAGKELTLPLPVLALLFDRFVAHRAPTLLACVRADAILYAGYLVLAVGYLAVRQGVLAGAGGSDLVYPYFVAPSRPDFLQHVWHQIRTYGENLLLAGITPPFLTAGDVAGRTTLAGTAATCVAPAVALWVLRRQAAAWWFALLALCTWLPATVVYISERYLLLPSFGVAGIAGLAVARAPRALGIVVLAWFLHQVWWLHTKNQRISQTVQDSIALHEHVQSLADRLPPGQPIYVLNLPVAAPFAAQFFADLVRVVLDDRTRECHVLTTAPEDLVQLQSSSVVRRSSHQLEVAGSPALMTHSRWAFPRTSLAAGTRVARARLGCEVEIVEGEETRCQVVRFTLPRPLDECVFVRFTLPPTSVPTLRGVLIRRGRLDIVKP